MINRLLIEYVKKVPIQEVVSYYDIKQNKDYISCPFHNERTPSAKIYEDTNSGYCFGCHKLFDGIELVKLFEEVDFEKAVNFLYKTFTAAIFETTNDKKSDLTLYHQLNNELRDLINIVGRDKEKRITVAKTMQTIDLNAENNLLILKVYQKLLEEIK